MLTDHFHFGLVETRPVFGVSDKARLKSVTGATGYNFQVKLYCLKIGFVLANSVDPDEMLKLSK